MNTRSASPTRVQLLGYFGWGNFGDDLFRETCEDRAFMLWPGSQARAFEQPQANFADMSLTARVRRLSTAFRGALWADAFAYCGGSVFSEISGTSALRSRLFRNHSFAALGVSVGPFDSNDDRRDVIRVLSAFDRVVVRDEDSFQRLGGTCEFGGDLAALSRRFDPSPNVSARTSSAKITICPSSASNESGSRLADSVATGLGGADADITVLALNSHPRLGDREIADAIARRLRDDHRPVRVLDYSEIGIDGVIGELRESDLVWSQRLHGAIASYLLDVPVAIVDHHEKCGAFARDIGLDDAFLVNGFNELTPTTTLVSEETAPGGPTRLPWTRPSAEYRSRAMNVYGGGAQS